VSECDSEATKMRRPWPTGGCCDLEIKGKEELHRHRNILVSKKVGKVKVKESLNRPGVAQRIPGGLRSRIS
jgi:hypothetical protein